MAEVLVLIDFEGTMKDEMCVKTGDVVKKVTKASEEGWLEGELRGKRGIFPANFVKEVPVYLIGESKREPRSLRKSRMMKQTRRCEVAFAYTPLNEDELELAVGETVQILREIEDGWWMGMKSGKVGAFPSNFVKEVFVSPKDARLNEGKARPKLTDAVFSKETKQPQRTTVRNKNKNVMECCLVMFDYTACTDDELDLKKGETVTIISKESEDDGWWEGEVDGRQGFFPDNFVMVIPPTDSLQFITTGPLPARQGTTRRSVKAEASVMEKVGPAKTKDEKPDGKDLRTNPPIKVKLPPFNKPGPPPVKDKPVKVLPKTNGEAPVVPKRPEDKDSDQFDALDVSPEKLLHPTANRAKPPQRRPPSGLVIVPQAQSATDQTDVESSPKMPPGEKSPGLPKVTETLPPTPSKPELLPKTPPPARPAARPKVMVDAKALNHKDEASLESLQAEIKDLRLALELLQTRQERDMQEVKEELKEERNKRMALQDEVQDLRMKH